MPSEGYAPKSPDLSSLFSAPAPAQQQQQVPPYQQYAYQQHLQPHQQHPQYQPQQGFYQPPPQHQQQPPHNSLSYLQSPPPPQLQPQQHQGQPAQQPYYNAPGSAGGGGQAYGQPPQPQPEQHHQHHQQQQQPPPRYGSQPPLPQHQLPQQYQGYGGISHYQQPGQPQYGSPLEYQLQPPFTSDPYPSATLPPQQPHHQYSQAHVTPQQHQPQHQHQQQLELKLEEIGLASPNSMPPRRSAAAAAAAIAASAAAEAAEASEAAEAATSSVSPGPPAAFSAPAVDPRTIIAHSPVKTKFPTARIKRIMQADEEVGKVSQQTPIAVGKALELFMVNLVSKSAEIARAKNSKRVTAQMLKQVVESDDQWDFLRDIVKKIDPDEKHGRGPRNSTGGAGGPAEGSAPGGGTRLKLESDSGDEEQPKKRGRPGRKKKL